jgi:hypothetical protein
LNFLKVILTAIAYCEIYVTWVNVAKAVFTAEMWQVMAQLAIYVAAVSQSNRKKLSLYI